MNKTLSQPALDMIERYVNLQVGDKTVPCPYFNNKRNRVRGALGVHIGKGQPEDIGQEMQIIAMKQHIKLSVQSSEDITALMVDNNIGIDCSGFVYHVLNAERGGALKSNMKFPKGNVLRKLIGKLRTAENVNVKVLTDEKNSTEVALTDVTPGDLIVMMETGEKHDLDHVLLIEKVEYNEHDTPTKIHYVHSLRWNTDGKYSHGIKRGVIEIADAFKGLLEQTWTEAEKNDDTNETLWRAVTAKKCEIRKMR